jgi:hypothetical protein
MGVTAVSSPQASERTATRALAVPWHIPAVLFASTSMVVGVIWDISWHMTIGRDTFWTPAHLAIYLGGVVGGLASGFVVLKTTFAGSAAERAASVRFWGFRGPLGAWVTIWGALAMLTSAPFDDWWHNAYGLDVQILSPPHVVLAVGIIAISVGAMLGALAYQNRSDTRGGWIDRGYVYGAGLVLTFVAILATEYTDRILHHSSVFYVVACGAFPFILIGAASASRLKWPATTIAAVYMFVTVAMVWVLPLFPAEPLLGPIRRQLTHMVPMDFPLLLIAPAVVVDLAAQRAGKIGDWRRAVAYGVIFFVVLLVVQFAFSYFLMSRWSMTPLFATENFDYAMPDTWYKVRREFYPWDATEGAMRARLGLAVVLAVVSARAGLAWGSWMRRVRR